MINDYWSCPILFIDNIQKPNTGEEFSVNTCSTSDNIIHYGVYFVLE